VREPAKRPAGIRLCLELFGPFLLQGKKGRKERKRKEANALGKNKEHSKQHSFIYFL